MEKTCVECHSGAEANAGLALDHFTSLKTVLKERRTWEKVIQRIKIGDMPPKDADPLLETDRAKLIEWLQSAILDVDCGKTPNPGAVTLRRLNRSEYRNTVRDLLGVDFIPADDFPGDDVGYGFDNIGDVLTLPPILMEKYFAAADAISRQAIVAPDASPEYEVSYKGSQLTFKGHVGKADDRLDFFSEGVATWTEQIPWTGSYVLELIVGGTIAAKEPAKMLVSIDDKKVKEVAVLGTLEKPKAMQFPLKLKAGSRKINIAFTNDFYVEAKDGKPIEDRNLYLFELKISGKKATERIPSEKLTPLHKSIVIAEPDRNLNVEDAVRKVMQPLVSRAFRRPVTKSELDRLIHLVTHAIDAGESYEAGLQIGLQAILVSPHFLFKVEQPTKAATGEYPKINEFELASRLSYFLWSTMPDSRLLQLAVKKELSKPEVLSTEVKRMIQDIKANEFVDNFAAQWLTLRKLDLFEPNPKMFPKWNDQIRNLLRRETYTFFAGVMREDLSILTLIDGDFTYLNEDLATYYGISGIEGENFRKVSLKGQPRMGLLTQGSILAVTSNPTRTSPVKRGKFILDNILGLPPPPAPPGVPELEKAELKGTLRNRMEQHRADPACAGCHKLMDPLGFALENYDAIGLWRTNEGPHKVDSSGVLIDGTQVKHAGELIRHLRKNDSEAFSRCLAEKMLTFATGRGMEYYDRCAVDQIVAKLKQNDYRFSTLVTEIVLSGPFQRLGERE